MSELPLITRDKDVLGGVPVFYGTRVPVQTLIDYLATGETIDAFLDDFPTVSREQAVRFLETIGALVASQDDANPSLEQLATWRAGDIVQIISDR